MKGRFLVVAAACLVSCTNARKERDEVCGLAAGTRISYLALAQAAQAHHMRGTIKQRDVELTLLDRPLGEADVATLRAFDEATQNGEVFLFVGVPHHWTCRIVIGQGVVQSVKLSDFD